MNVLEAASSITEIDTEIIDESRAYQLRLTKPPLSLGVLEEIANRFAAFGRTMPPKVPSKAILAIFAGDHGVLDEGVSPWPREVTAQMVKNFLAGGAAANVLARRGGVNVVVVDVGIASELEPSPDLVSKKIRYGTRNLARESALTRAEVIDSMQVGFDLAIDLVEAGYEILATGDMGIGNTTASSALIASICEVHPELVTGRGTGITDEVLAKKVEIIRIALARTKAEAVADDPILALCEFGGLEHGALVGFILGGAYSKVAVVLDGIVSNAAALIATKIAPMSIQYMFAGHSSRESGAKVALDYLGLRPIVDLNLALGEGTGALIALTIIQSAVALLGEMATFDSAGVTEK